jgi:hypothetical protein
MDTIIGECSECGGDVTLHTGPWFGVTPPEPHCQGCGATPKRQVIQMRKAQPRQRRYEPLYDDQTRLQMAQRLGLGVGRRGDGRIDVELQRTVTFDDDGEFDQWLLRQKSERDTRQADNDSLRWT